MPQLATARPGSPRPESSLNLANVDIKSESNVLMYSIKNNSKVQKAPSVRSQVQNSLRKQRVGLNADDGSMKSIGAKNILKFKGK